MFQYEKNNNNKGFSFIVCLPIVTLILIAAFRPRCRSSSGDSVDILSRTFCTTVVVIVIGVSQTSLKVGGFRSKALSTLMVSFHVESSFINLPIEGAVRATLWKEAGDLSLSNAKMLVEKNEDYVKDHGLIADQNEFLKILNRTVIRKDSNYHKPSLRASSPIWVSEVSRAFPRTLKHRNTQNGSKSTNHKSETMTF